MRIRMVALGLAVAAPASALLVACGGSGQSDDERYGDAFTEVAQPMNAALIDLGSAVAVATSRKQIAAALGRTDTALDTAREGFAQLDPPDDDVAEIQDTLVSAIGKFQKKMGVLRDSARDDKDSDFNKAVSAFNAESQSFAQALGTLGKRLDDAGVPLGEPAPAAGTAGS